MTDTADTNHLDEAEGPAEPLKLWTAYKLAEAAGENPADLATDGAALARYWRDLVEYCAGKMERRSAAAREIGEAHARGEGGREVEIHRWSYGQKIEIKTAEQVLELLHRILAPAAPFVCDERCAHVRAGATAGQVKRFLDSIDAAVADRRRQLEHAGGSPCFEDLHDELYVLGRWRHALVVAARPAA